MVLFGWFVVRLCSVFGLCFEFCVVDCFASLLFASLVVLWFVACCLHVCWSVAAMCVVCLCIVFGLVVGGFGGLRLGFGLVL